MIQDPFITRLTTTLVPLCYSLHLMSPHVCRNLCDNQSLGKLNMEQFALAMYLIQQKLKGVEPPTQLTPDMMPPSMRTATVRTHTLTQNQWPKPGDSGWWSVAMEGLGVSLSQHVLTYLGHTQVMIKLPWHKL